MRFNLVTHLAKRPAAAQTLRRRLFASNNGQWRTYIPSGQRHHHPKDRFVGTQFSFFSYFPFIGRYYSSKPSNSEMGILRWYLNLLESRPIVTKSVSSAVIYAAADITSQLITMAPADSWDLLRTVRMAVFGLIILGPAQHVWFNFVARVLPNRDVLTTFKKLGFGQLFYGPLINGVFFSFNAGLQGENLNEIFARLSRDLIPTLLNGLLYWPLCDFFTYKVIPVRLQPLMNSSFSYLWTIYLTYMASLTKAVLD